jgi:hypothetical protein
VPPTDLRYCANASANSRMRQLDTRSSGRHTLLRLAGRPFCVLTTRPLHSRNHLAWNWFRGHLVQLVPGPPGGTGSGATWWNWFRNHLAWNWFRNHLARNWFRDHLAERAPGRVAARGAWRSRSVREGPCGPPQEDPAREGGSTFFHHEHAPVARNGCASGLQPDVAAVSHRARSGAGVARRGARGEKTSSPPSRASFSRRGSSGLNISASNHLTVEELSDPSGTVIAAW